MCQAVTLAVRVNLSTAASASVVLLQFVRVVQANIYAKINALVNVTITKVTTGSAIVENSVAFTSSDNSAAEAGRTALFQTLSSGDTSVFGTTFGSVAVSNVTQTTTTNPSKLVLLLLHHHNHHHALHAC